MIGSEFGHMFRNKAFSINIPGFFIKLVLPSLQMKFFLTVLFSLFFSSLFSQSYPYLFSGRSNALGGIQSTLFDINGLMANPASSSGIENIALLASVQDRFLINDVRSAQALAGYSFEGGSVGIGLTYQGFDLYNEQGIFLNYSRRLLENLFIGANIHYKQFEISEHGSTNWFTFQLGIHVPLSDEWSFAASIYNPLSVDISDTDSDITMISVGIRYSPSTKTTLFAEVDKDIDFDPNLKVGIEYLPLESLFIRFGYSSDPSAVYFGFGFRLGSTIEVDLASSYHNFLGYSPAASITINL